MKLLVCFKIVNELESVMEKDWDEASVREPDISYTKKIINCYDEAALEMALRLKAQAGERGEECTVTAVTIDGGNQDFIFKNLFAVGVDRIIQIDTNEDIRFVPYKIAGTLCRLVGGEVYDAVFMGRQNSIGDNGQTPLALAHLLGLPCVSHVTDIGLGKGGFRVEYQIEGGVRRGTLAKPAVYAVGNSRHPYLRVATLREKLAASKCQAHRLEPEHSTALPGPADHPMIRLRRQKSTRDCVFVAGETTMERAKALYEQYLMG